MGVGCMRGGFHWGVDGAGTARRRGMRVRFRRRTNCASSVTLVTRKVVGGCRGSERGIRSGLGRGSWVMAGTARAETFKFATSASAGIVPRSTGCWSLTRWKRVGLSRITTVACNAWQSAFWSRSERRRSGEILSRQRAESSELAIRNLQLMIRNPPEITTEAITKGDYE
jgi:hypothetical protein